MLNLKLVRSLIGTTKKQQACVKGLGLKNRINATKQVLDTPENRGMINVVKHLITVEKYD